MDLILFLIGRTKKSSLFNSLISVCLFLSDLLILFGLTQMLGSLGDKLLWRASIDFLLIVIVGVLFRALLRCLQAINTGRFISDLQRSIRKDFISRVFTAAYKASPSQVFTQFFYGVEDLCIVVRHIHLIFGHLIVVLSLYIFLIFYMPSVAALMSVFFLLVVILQFVFGSKVSSLSHRVSVRIREISRLVLSASVNLMSLRLSGGKSKVQARIDSEVRSLGPMLSKSIFLSSSTASLVEALGVIYVVVSIVFIVRTSSAPIEAVAGMLFVTMRMIQSIPTILDSRHHIVMASPRASEVMRVLNKNGSVFEAPCENLVLRFRPKLLIDHVCLTTPLYASMSCSISVEKNEILLLTGPSGSGKTSLLSILAGERKIESGKVMFEINSKSFTVSELREKFQNPIAYLGPDPFLFPGSLRENLLLGSMEDFTDRELYSFLESVGCSFVAPDRRQLAEIIDETGSGLSTGEMQRICLARAFISQPKIMLLDEPFANLDKENTQLMLKTIGSLKKDILFIISSHHYCGEIQAEKVLNLGVS